MTAYLFFQLLERVRRRERCKQVDALAHPRGLCDVKGLSHRSYELLLAGVVLGRGVEQLHNDTRCTGPTRAI